MILKVIWSGFAEKQLDEILEYYHKNISIITAKKIVQSILLETTRLDAFPLGFNELPPYFLRFS